MSSFMYYGNTPRYRITVGFDSKPFPTVFGRVEDLARERHGLSQEQTDRGERPEEPVILQVGSAQAPLKDIQTLVSALAPYGPVPPILQVHMLRELDEVEPLTLSAVGVQLAAICQPASSAHLAQEPSATERTCLLLAEQGWQISPWHRRAEQTLDEAFAHWLFPGQRVSLETVHGGVSDRSILFRVCAYGFLHELPVLAISTGGTAWSGPIGIAQANEGLTAEQVRLVQHEVCVVDPSIRLPVSSLWYHVWSTLKGRGW
ncbi:MAG TPA: hypothetical protein VFV38_05320 [Ktedonobacteraceae bacterium]|nr:hypothetical protein [Ktedonobacteraceae bacterium]